jgi:hypothetical protein
MHATSGTDDEARVGDAFPTLELPRPPVTW